MRDREGACIKALSTDDLDIGGHESRVTSPQFKNKEGDTHP